MTLEIVRTQWHRVVFMQTNREDVGQRYLEIEISVPPSPQRAAEVSEPFRNYFVYIAEQRARLGEYLRAGDHHFFLSGVETAVEDGEIPLEAAGAEIVD